MYFDEFSFELQNRSAIQAILHKHLLVSRTKIFIYFSRMYERLDSDYLIKNYLIVSQIHFITHLFIFPVIFYLIHITLQKVLQ